MVKFVRLFYSAKVVIADLFMIIITLFFFGISAYINLGSMITYSDPVPPKIDLIFSFGGEDARDLYAAELYRTYPHVLWIASGNGRKSYIHLNIGNDFDSTRLTFVDSCKNTFSEVSYLKQWLQHHYQAVHKGSSTFHVRKPLTIGLVSGPYHMGRIRMVASRLIHGHSIVYLPVPMVYYPYVPMNFRRWWEDPFLSYMVPLEIKKMVYYWFRYL